MPALPSAEVAAAEMLARRTARRSLLGFTQYTFPHYGYITEPAHVLIAEHLDAVVEGKIDRLMIFAPPQHGKLVADSTPVPTPDGWVRHGDLCPGSVVYGADGSPARVVAVSTPDLASLDVHISDGSIITVHPRHEWTIFNRSVKEWQTRETGDLARLRLFAGERCNYQLPDIVPIQGRTAILPVDPYVLGAWLGDGTAGKPCFAHHVDDHAVIDAIAMAGHSTRRIYPINDGRGRLTYVNDLSDGLRHLGVYRIKRIPAVYLRADEQQRMELLAGLIDTDGHVFQRDQRVRIVTANPDLATDYCDLIRSLGWRAAVFTQQPQVSSSGIVGRKPVHSIAFTPDRPIPTRMPQKGIVGRPGCQRRLGITAILPSLAPEQGRCIKVDAPDGLYLVGHSMIPTHNSQLATVNLSAYWLGRRPDDPVAIVTYGAELAEPKSRQARDLVESEVYRRLFPTVRVNPQARSMAHWELLGHRGLVHAVGIGGAITGHGFRLGIVDDPHKDYESAMSKAQREAVIDYYKNTFVTRIWEGGAIIVIQTRWHEEDLSGVLLKEQPGRWTVLRLPALAETQQVRDFRNQKLGLPLGLPDPLGREPEEPLTPRRFSYETLDAFRRSNLMGYTAQYQGFPTTAEGNLIKRNHFQIIDTPPPPDCQRLRYWDKAATAGGGDYTAGVLLAYAPAGDRLYVEDVQRGQWSIHQRERLILMTAQADRARYGAHGYREPRIMIEQEPGGAGKESAENTIRRLIKHGFGVRAERPTGEKEVRIRPFADFAEQFGVKLMRGPWNDPYIDELTAVPNGAYWDQTDATSGAFNNLMRGGAWSRGY